MITAIKFYTEWASTFNMLSDAEAGRLIKHIGAYIIKGDVHIPDTDRLIAVAFESIKVRIEIDLQKNQHISSIRKEIGQRGGIKKNQKIGQKKSKEVTPDQIVEVKKIPNSIYGDGELHYKCVQYERENHGKYHKTMYEHFLLHWTAPLQKGVNKGMEAWRQEKTFSLAGRLATWNSISKTNSKPDKQQYINQVAEDLNKIFNN